MNKLFKIHKANLMSIRRTTVPTGDYWVSVPPNSNGMLVFTQRHTRKRWLLSHNEWRKGENKGWITYEYS